MKTKIVYFVSLLVLLNGMTFAQVNSGKSDKLPAIVTIPQIKENQTSIISPDNNIDYKMIIIDPELLSKGRVPKIAVFNNFQLANLSDIVNLDLFSNPETKHTTVNVHSGR